HSGDLAVDLLGHGRHLLVRRGRYRVEQGRTAWADLVHAVDHERVEVDVEVERGAEPLDDGHAAGLEGAAYPVRPRAPPQPARDDADEAAQHDACESGVEGHAEAEPERNG